MAAVASPGRRLVSCLLPRVCAKVATLCPRWLGSSLGLLLLAPMAFGAGLRSPEVQADGTVTFRLAWGAGDTIELVGRGPNQTDFPSETYLMARASGDLWEITIGPLLPGVHFYRFRINGRDVPDPANPQVQDFLNGPWSRFEVTDPEARPWTHRAGIPRGTVEMRRYESRVLRQERPVWVYLPPGYESLPDDVRLPVVYLLHGSTYDERSWVELGRVPSILDGLIADGRAVPMIVVMPFGYAELPRFPDVEPSKEYAPWAEHLLADVLPWVERTYRVAADRGHRAVAGLSMGGAQALQLGLSHPGVFGAIGAFSAGRKAVDVFPAAYAAAFAPGALRPRLLWLGCGRGDRYFELKKTLPDKFAARGIATVWHEVEGRHTWRVWRECFSEFAPLAFPPGPAASPVGR